MIKHFLFDILPLYLAKLGDLARASALYHALTALWHRCAALVRESFCARLWRGSDRVRGWVKTSLFCAWADAVILWMRDFAGKCFDWIVPPLSSSYIAVTIGRIPRYSFSWLYGVVFLACYCCPGPMWRNQYALLLSFFLFGTMLLESWSADRRPFRVRDLTLGFPVFAAATLLSVFFAADRSESFRVFCFYFSAFLFCVSLVGTVTNRGRLMSVLGFIYLTLLLTSLYAIFQRIRGVEVSTSLTDLVLNAGMPGRVYSTLENPNNYAEFIVLTFPVSLVFCANVVDRRWKTLAVGSMVIPVVALLMTYSRSSWVSFALAAVVFLALWDKRLLPPFPVVALLAIPLLPDTILNRILTIGNTADSSNAYRLYIWSSALHMIRDFGLTGIGLGPGNFTPLYADYCNPRAAAAQHSHMLYLEVWLEMGLLGIVSFLCLYLGVIRRGIRAMRHADPLLRWVLIACVSSLVGVSFVGAAEYIWFYPRIMFAFFILIGITLSAAKLAEESK